MRAAGGMHADDAAVAERIAAEAGDALLQLRDRAGATADDAPMLRAEADRVSQELIRDRLQQLRPDDLVLSEEAPDDKRRLDAERVWIVDPLDGTREYAEHIDGGWRDDWAVHVALWTREAGVCVGAVALPARGRVFGTGTPTPLRARDPRAGRALRLAVSRSHPAPIVQYLRQNFPIDLVPMGSAGVKAMAVVTGEVDGYVHDGGQYEWDSAAPVAVARAAGCLAQRLDGSALRYNQVNPWLPDLVICAPSASAVVDGMLRTRPQEKARTTE